VTVQVPEVLTDSVPEEIVQPVAVPSATTNVTAPPDEPPDVTSVRGVPSTPSREATLNALWFALFTLSVAADEVAVAVVPE
jgi:hypothetical protein